MAYDVSGDAAYTLKDVIARLQNDDRGCFSDQAMRFQVLDIVERQTLVPPDIQFDDESAKQFVEALATAYVRSEWFLHHSANHGALGLRPVDDADVRLAKVQLTISMRRCMGWSPQIGKLGR